MMAPSVERAVGRALLRAIAMLAAAIVGVSAVGTTILVVHRNDREARAQALTLAAELHNHRRESLESLRELVRHELSEQRSFGRHIEVWRDGGHLGTDRGSLGRWAGVEGCVLADADRALSRICSVLVSPGTMIVVASPVAPFLFAQVPILASTALSALVAAAAFSVVARRLARRSLAPLNAFDSAVADLPALVAGRRLPAQWNAAEVDQLAATFNSLLERMDGALAREQRFVANAAHELRTPITRLRGQLELVQAEDVLADGVRRRIELATRSCLELGRSLEAILALARSEPLALETLDLGELVPEALASFAPDEHERVTVTAESASVRGEGTLLRLALRNLVDNALKYSARAVEVVVSEDVDECRVTVRDHGAGIADDDLPRIREPFIRGASRPRSVRGSGLGLALVEHVATQHGGRLELVNGGPETPGLSATLLLPPWRSERR